MSVCVSEGVCPTPINEALGGFTPDGRPNSEPQRNAPPPPPSPGHTGEEVHEGDSPASPVMAQRKPSNLSVEDARKRGAPPPPGSKSMPPSSRDSKADPHPQTRLVGVNMHGDSEEETPLAKYPSVPQPSPVATPGVSPNPSPCPSPRPMDASRTASREQVSRRPPPAPPSRDCDTPDVNAERAAHSGASIAATVVVSPPVHAVEREDGAGSATEVRAEGVEKSTAGNRVPSDAGNRNTTYGGIVQVTIKKTLKNLSLSDAKIFSVMTDVRRMVYV